MKPHIIKSLAALALGAMLLTTTACAQSNDEAKNVLRHSREKCQSIKQGHYVMEHWKKFVSDKDTNLTIYTCDFRKVRRDRLFGKFFAMQYENPGHPEWNGYTLYTGEEFVTYSDSTGEIMSCKKWKDKMADFLAKRSVTYTVLFSDRELSNTYHIVAYPTLFFIDRDGKIAKVQRGYHPTLEAAIEGQLQKLLE